MKTQHEIAQDEKRRGSLIGSLFVAPVLLALTVLALWVLIAVLLTPGVQAETAYGAAQRSLRGTLIGVGMLFDTVGFGVLLLRLAKPIDAG